MAGKIHIFCCILLCESELRQPGKLSKLFVVWQLYLIWAGQLYLSDTQKRTDRIVSSAGRFIFRCLLLIGWIPYSGETTVIDTM